MTIENAKAAILPKLLAAAEGFDGVNGTPEEAELAAAQVLAYEALDGVGNRYRYFYDDSGDFVVRYDIVTGVTEKRDGDAWVAHAPAASGGGAAAGSGQVASAPEGRLFTQHAERALLTTTASFQAMHRNQPPLVRNGNLYWGGVEPITADRAMFLKGPVAGLKRWAEGDPSLNLGEIANQRVCYDEVNDTVYMWSEGNFVYYAQADMATVQETQHSNLPGNVATAIYHPWFKKSLIAISNWQEIWYADDVFTNHTAATMPNMSNVGYNADHCHLAATPTAALMFHNQAGDTNKAIQRSVDGMTWAHVAEATHNIGVQGVLTSDWFAGRLWVCSGGGLFSTADDGDTWRADISAGSGIVHIFHNSQSGRFIACGSQGFWNSDDGVTWTKVSGNDITRGALAFRGSFHVEDHRVIYACGEVYSERGERLLSEADFLHSDWSTTSTFVGPVIPQGSDRIMVFFGQTDASAANTYVVDYPYGIYVPPADGAMVELKAIGSGGTISVDAATIDGKDTIVSNWMVAAGGDHSDVAQSTAVGTHRGSPPIATAVAGWSTTGGSSGGTYEFRGGEGLPFGSRQYGHGETIFANAQQISPPGQFIGMGDLGASDRGGWSGAIATFSGRIDDPIPVLPGQWQWDVHAYGKSGAGAVIIKEL